MGKLLGTLVVVVLKAKNLPNKQRIGKQDAYATIVYRGQRNKTQVVRKAGQHPIFDDEFRYEVREDLEEEIHAEVTASGGVKPAQEGKRPPKGRTLRISVYSDDPRDPILIGDATIDFEETMSKGEFDEWITLNDVQKKYAGEIFIEMTYYDQTRKLARPRSMADEFGALPPGLRGSLAGQDGLRASSLGSAGPQLRASTSYHRLSSAGIEPYAPNYASGLIPPGREASPSTGRSPLSGPPRHNSLNDAEIAAFSASMNAMSVGRKPLPLPGSGPRPPVNSADLPASFHAHRLSLPNFQGIAQQRAYSYEPKLPAQPEASTSALPQLPAYGRGPVPVPPSGSPSGIEGWRHRVHSETHAPDSATLPSRASFHNSPISAGLPSPSSQLYKAASPPMVPKRQSPSPRPFPPAAAPGYPPQAEAYLGPLPGGFAQPLGAEYDGSSRRHSPQPRPNGYNAAPIPSRVPPGYVPGPPPPGFGAPSDLPRPPMQKFAPGYPTHSLPAQRPFESIAYPPVNGYLPNEHESARPLQSSPDALGGEQWRQQNGSHIQQSMAAPALYQSGETISGMARGQLDSAPPRPPEQMRPQASTPNLRQASPGLPGAYYASPGLEAPSNAPLRFSSAQYSPPAQAVQYQPVRASSYGGPTVNEQPGLVRPLPLRPEPSSAQQMYSYAPPRHS